MKNNREPLVILITGTTSGLGLMLAKTLYHSAHHIIIATARETSIEILEQENLIDHPTFSTRILDVLQLDLHAQFISDIIKDYGRIDILINNAGISYRGVVEHMTDQEEYEQICTNYLGPMSLIRSVVPYMRKRHRGMILNVSSVGGMMAMPTMSSYCASKFALEGATESLWYELKPWNINVSLIEIGFINSLSFRRVKYPMAYNNINIDENPYLLYYRYMGRFVERLMTHAIATPEGIAKKITTLFEKKKIPLRLPVSIDAKLFFYIRRLLPRRLYHYILYRCLPGIKDWENYARSYKCK